MNITGAGLLLFTNIENKLHVILYKNKYKQTYEDLGGTFDKNDKNIYKTASRESYEESATYVDIKDYELQKSKKVFLNTYVCFLKKVKNFNVLKAKELLFKFKNKEYYNEMDDVIIVPVNDLLEGKIRTSNRLTSIINKIYNNNYKK